MTQFIFVMHAILALASRFIVLHALARQQPWKLSTPLVPSLSSVQVPLSSAAAQFWSLSTTESHRQPFPYPANVHRTTTNHSSQTSSAENSVPHTFGSDGAVRKALRWSLTNTNGSIHVDALFPSLVHLDLLRAGIIQDPNIGLNEGLYRWIIDEPTWSYTADLTPILEQLPLHNGNGTLHQAQFWLYFQGLDTIVDVYIGGELVTSTWNQHKWHAFPVPAHLLKYNASPLNRSTLNSNITLAFNNVNSYAAEQAERFDPGYPSQIQDAKPRATDYEYPNRIFVRKQQSDLGWDWGPALVPVGPHKPAYLICLENGGDGSQRQDASRVGATKPRSVVVLASGFDIYRKGQTNNVAPPHPDANWIVNVTLTLLCSNDVHWPSLRLSIPALGVDTFDTLLSSPVVSAGLNAPVYAVFEIPSSGNYAPLLWWPRGYGEQTLYEAVVRSEQLGVQVTKKVGFRTAFFDLSPISSAQVQQGVQPGSNFRLIVNGQEIYVMGTNMIPLDTLSPRASPAYLRWLLESSLAAHVNLIRVWGGGSYAWQELLEMCDELGIMVWMDAMFAASLYPYHQAFLDEVQGELAQVMVDVISHPSLVVVVGNNEGELYFLGGYGRREEDAEWKRGYEQLFDLTVRDQVLEASRGLSYIPCSTTTGYISLNPYKGRYDHYDHQTELHGTGEHYGYNAEVAFDINTYPRSRFMVEFGMFSLPSIHTLDRILTNTDEYNINSTILRAHLKHPPAGNLSYPFPADQGQFELLNAITTYLPTPSSLASLSLRDQLDHWSYLSQLYQLLYISNQISVYRAGTVGSQRNRGLIVWQLNDVWQGTSWSSIEWDGRWKMIQYGLVDVQARVVVVAIYNGTADRLEISVQYSIASGEEVIVELDWFSFTGQPLDLNLSNRSKSFQLQLPPQGIGCLEVETLSNVSQSICNPTSNPNGCILRLGLTYSSNYHPTYWTPISQLKSTLTHLSLRPQLQLDHIDHWQVLVSTDNIIAPFVWIQHAPPYIGYFAQCNQHTNTCKPYNAFWLLPHTQVLLTFIHPPTQPASSPNIDQEQHWFDSLTISCLLDNLPLNPLTNSM